MDEQLLEKEVEVLLRDAENYLLAAKTKKVKDARNFEGLLALEYANKARTKCQSLRNNKEFYDKNMRRIRLILEELKKIPLVEERKLENSYEEGDVGGG